jgi:predicted ribosome-associated RNA-binding protein Tma20
MRTLSTLWVAGAAGLLLTACSQGTTTSGTNPAAVAQARAAHNGIGPNGFAPRHLGALHGWLSPRHSKSKLLYVSNEADNVVYIYSVPAYALVGQITDGLNQPEGIATDKKGNLYVSNLSGNTITVYHKGTTSPSLTLAEPFGPDDVAVTSDGYVVAGDSGGVDVFNPGATSASSRLTNSTISSVDGIGVDARNNVYAVGPNASSQPAVVEFADLGGSGTNLGLTGLLAPTGVLVDQHGNIAVSDFALPGINLYKPGHTAPFATIAASDATDRSAIDHKQNLIYVPEADYSLVNIYKYPSGKFVKGLTISGSGNFISGAALSPAPAP